MREYGIKLFVNLYGYAGYEDYVKGQGASVITYPIDDMCFSPIEEIHVRILNVIQRNRGRKVFVHCYAGIGRSGTLVSMYLIRKGMSYEAAYNKVKELCPLWPESRIQSIAPKWYERLLKKIGPDVIEACYVEGNRYLFGGSLGHASTVANIALDILEEYVRMHLVQGEGWKWKVVYIAGMLHDIGRYDSSGEIHHIRSAQIVEDLSTLKNILSGKELEIVKYLIMTHRARVDPVKCPQFKLIPSKTEALFLSSCVRIADAFHDVYTVDFYEGCRLERDVLVIHADEYMRGRIANKSRILKDIGIRTEIGYR